MDETEKSIIKATGLIMSNGQTTLQDTNLVKLKIKITGTADAKEFADVLANEYGVDNANTGFPVGTTKEDLRDYGVYAEISFGTELQGINTFEVQMLSATFTHYRKDTKDGVDEGVFCNIDCIKNYDDADGDINFWTKRKECRGGKKSFIPLVFNFYKLGNNPVVFTPIEVDEGAEEAREENERVERARAREEKSGSDPVVVEIPEGDD